MSIRHYRKPIFTEHLATAALRPQESMPEINYMDVFVILEEPLLEFGHADLVFLRTMRIDPFTDVE